MKYLSLFSLLLITFISYSQPNLTPNSDSLEDANYVLLSNDKIIKADKVSYESKMFKKDYFLVDNERYEIGQVKFYQNTEGFFGRVDDYYQVTFAERTSSGDINLFELTVQTSSAPIMNANGTMTGGYSGSDVIDYYNKGFGPLKRATYANLKIDLSDRPEAKLYLDKYNQTRMIQNGLYVAGGIVLASSFIAFYREGVANPEDFDATNTLVIAGLGGATLFSAYIVGLSKKEKLKEAIAAYNRF